MMKRGFKKWKNTVSKSGEGKLAVGKRGEIEMERLCKRVMELESQLLRAEPDLGILRLNPNQNEEDNGGREKWASAGPLKPPTQPALNIQYLCYFIFG